MKEILENEMLDKVSGGVMIDGVEYYHVKAGDTLSEIAERYHVTTSALAAANNISNPDRITAGQMLIIPQNNK